MNQTVFRAALKRNGLSCDEFAAMLGRNINTIYGFGGKTPVPYYARLVLRLLDERRGSHGLIGKDATNH